MKKKILVLLGAAMIMGGAMAQEAAQEGGYQFTNTKVLPITPVKNQAKAGTCWDYAGTAFIEAELLRMGKGEYDFSEMFNAYNDYQDRAAAVIRCHGDMSFSQGGCFGDLLHVMERYGLVPEEEMRPGVMYRDSLSNHTELSNMTNPMVKAAASSPSLQSDSSYQLLALKAIKAVHDVYLGVPPERFTYQGKEYTPRSFYESTGLKAADYVQITAFLHYPQYSTFAVESPDNWRHDLSYNVSLDELLDIMDRAIAEGYPVGWDSDVSEAGFRAGSKKGFVVLPATDTKGDDLKGSDMAHWMGMSAQDIMNEAAEHPTPQRWVSPEERQLAWENHETNDDHLMLIYGSAKDQMGNEYYMVKNSWGNYNSYGGCFYASKAYVRYKTVSILLHKDALSKEMRKKLGIK